MRRRVRQRGVALVMVLVAVTVLAALVSTLMEDNEVELAVARNARHAFQAEHLARSGVNLSRLLLSMQPVMDQQIRSFNIPLWKFASVMMKPFSNPKESESFSKVTGISLDESPGLGVNEGTFSVKIVDEDSKININLAFRDDQKLVIAKELLALFSPPQFDRFFGAGLEGEDLVPREVLVAEIIDWVDPDEELFGVPGGMEDGVYSQRTPPYERKNAPFDSLEELHLVRGMTDDIWHTFVDADPTEPDRRMITVWGGEKINVNTAPPGVLLMAICLIGGESAQMVCDPNNMQQLLTILGIVQFRRKIGLTFRNVRDFVNVLKEPLPGVTGVSINGRTAALYLTTKSKVFSIYATGQVGEIQKRIHAVVDLSQSRPAAGLTAAGGVQEPSVGGKVLYWRMD